MKHVWIDFNDIHDDVTTTLLKFADGELHPGERVLCYDNEGIECQGVVESLRRKDGLVILHIDHDTILHLPAEREF